MFPIINLGPLSMPSAPLILLLAFWAGSALAERKASAVPGRGDAVEKILWSALLAVLIGGRISFIARHPAAFQGALLSIFSLNPALLDPQGGILVSLAVSYYLTAKQGISPLELLDSLVPFFAVMVPAMALARFANGSGFGTATALPWGIEIWGASRHPVQLYYAAAGLAVLAYTIIRPATSASGREFLRFLLLTSGYLTFLSAFQEPAGSLLGGFRVFQLVYWSLFCASILINYRILEISTHEPAKR